MNYPKIRLAALSVLIPMCFATSLSAEVKAPEGFAALFNGKDLSGWWGLNTENPAKWMALSPEKLAEKKKKSLEDIAKHWSVDGDVLVNDGHGLFLSTEKNYGDFELTLEYKTVAKADSGVYLRGVPQVQIWDTTEEGGKWKIGADKGSGGLWNNPGGSPGKDPLVLADKPFGEWNSMRIVLAGDIATIHLNEKLVVDHARMHNYFDKKGALPVTGPIQLQTHGGAISWRNVFVREIGAKESKEIQTAASARDKAAATQWYKGNTHTHSLWSDGNDFPEMIVSWYKEQGYDFLALSDHNTLSRGERWMTVPSVEKRRRVKEGSTMATYRAKFGDAWVETRVKTKLEKKAGEKVSVKTEEVRLKTLEEFRPHFEKDGTFLLIEAEEVTDRFEGHQIHINAINIDEPIKAQHGDSVVETMRNNLRAIAVDAKVFGKPVLAHINHPNFHYSLTAHDLAHVLEAKFFEVYNGHPGINHLGNAEHPGDEELWDIAITLRLSELKADPMFGLATDDSHYYHGGNVSPGRGWVMVKAASLEANALVEAMKRGDFYASSGVVFEELGFDRKARSLRLKIAGVEGQTYQTKFIGTRKKTPEKIGEVLASVAGLEPSYDLQGDELYVRAVVTSSQAHPNPSFQDQHEQAWTQPVGWRK